MAWLTSRRKLNPIDTKAPAPLLITSGDVQFILGQLIKSMLFTSFGKTGDTETSCRQQVVIE